ncbi:MAG: hypothetical protein CBC48_14675 [bacterium TMED88]|nr:MAG: hypothetical protein CBC48_14675 [bacterium TMED88]
MTDALLKLKKLILSFSREINDCKTFLNHQVLKTLVCILLVSVAEMVVTGVEMTMVGSHPKVTRV